MPTTSEDVYNEKSNSCCQKVSLDCKMLLDITSFNATLIV